jgi:hypothetical protein
LGIPVADRVNLAMREGSNNAVDEAEKLGGAAPAIEGVRGITRSTSRSLAWRMLLAWRPKFGRLGAQGRGGGLCPGNLHCVCPPSGWHLFGVAGLVFGISTLSGGCSAYWRLLRGILVLLDTSSLATPMAPTTHAIYIDAVHGLAAPLKAFARMSSASQTFAPVVRCACGGITYGTFKTNQHGNFSTATRSIATS